MTSFAFLSISGRVLGPAAFAPLATLWVIVNAAGPAVFQPLEQELGRAVAQRRAQGHGARGVFLRGALLGAAIVVVCGTGLLVFDESLAASVFGGDRGLVLALFVGLSGLGAEHLTRGAFAGGGNFARYGWQLAIDGVLRVAGAGGLALLGVASVGWYGFALAAAPMAAVLLTAWRLGPAMQPAPADESWGELTRAVGVLMVGTLLAQLVVNAPPVAASVLAGGGEQARAGVFISVLVLARIPLFLFSAIQAAFLPGLAALIAQDDRAGFRRRLGSVLTVVGCLGLLGLVVAVAIGPWLVRVVYGPGFETTRLDLWPLAAGAGLFMLAQALAQTLIALRSYLLSLAGWAAGTAMFFLALSLPLRLEQRVGLAFFAATVAAAVTTGWALHWRLRRPPSSSRGVTATGGLAGSPPA